MAEIRTRAFAMAKCPDCGSVIEGGVYHRCRVDDEWLRGWLEAKIDEETKLGYLYSPRVAAFKEVLEALTERRKS